MKFRFRTTHCTARRIVTLVSTIVAAALAALVVAAPAYAGDSAKETKLFVKYATKSTCTVYLNYPKEGVLGNSSPWTVPAGEAVIWRYNVNDTWALISYSKRAHEIFPWWGFTRRDCLGTSVRQKGYPAGVAVPTRILEGRSRQVEPGWRPVDLSVKPAAVTEHGRRVVRNATLRDPANFVTGNVLADWHVDVTGRTRSDGHWIEVYVPNAKRWGYLERSALGL